MLFGRGGSGGSARGGVPLPGVVQVLTPVALADNVVELHVPRPNAVGAQQLGDAAVGDALAVVVSPWRLVELGELLDDGRGPQRRDLAEHSSQIDEQPLPERELRVTSSSGGHRPAGVPGQPRPATTDHIGDGDERFPAVGGAILYREL